MTVTVTPAAVPAAAAVDLAVVSDAGAVTVQVYRRDSGGIGLIRPTLTPVTTAAVTLRDDEAPQGERVDYVVVNGSGVTVASASIDTPTWGTWLKHPTRPWLNRRLRYSGDDARVLAADRVMVHPDPGDYSGTVLPTMLYGPRYAAAADSVVLIAATAQLAADVEQIVLDGAPLLLDIPPEYGAGWRYVAVGDVQIARYWPDDLTNPWRLVTLSGVVRVAPTADPIEDAAGRTYASIPAESATYGAVPLRHETYGDLTLGVEV